MKFAVTCFLIFISSSALASSPIPKGVYNTLDLYCIKCHSTPSSITGRLDLSQWIALPNGQNTFLHLDEDGTQWNKKETFEILIRRILPTSTDRMPLGEEIPEPQYSELRNWFESESRDQ